MLDPEQVNWRQDGVTQRFIANHESELVSPPSTSPALLAAAVTYCQDCDNPYAEELARRAGMLERYLHASRMERADVVRWAAKSFNILLV